jgi:hypothetical protein
MLPRKLNLNLRLLRVVLLLIIFPFNNIISQGHQTTASTEAIMLSVYTDVWQPFMESYRALDIEKFKSLQANDLTKVSIDRKIIQPKSVYFTEIEGFFNQFKQVNRQMDIKFSISSTATGDGKVYQTGYYCISSRRSNSESFQPIGYGFFTVILIEEVGLWKISMDADNQVTMSAEEFSKSDIIYELGE